ncbi:MAG TPA: amidohydrolase family protein [Vicinamibacterales bacterium]|nr:amidohydrolase family protein [Vicinamibacterales bacterium]
MTSHIFRSLVVAGLLAAASITVFAQQPYDLVISGGRVIDPESGLDAVRHVGIRGDRIAAISAAPLAGRDTVNATGLIVSPGFIDIHRHAVGNNSYQFAARDGVTSAFELEVGTPDVEAWYRMMGPSRLINFGVSAGHIGARMRVLGDQGFMLPTGPGRGPATPEQIKAIVAQIERGLSDGAVAVGIGTSYTPGADAGELTAVMDAASRHGAFVMAHLGGGIPRLQAAIGTAGKLRTPLHIAHINSTAGRDIKAWLETIAVARQQGADVTAELYPYTASASLIQSALYDNWEKQPDEWFATLQWAATGERLTRQTFAKYRAQGGSVISHSGSEENVRAAIADPLPMIGSDGGRDLDDRPTHPRASGTFARVLGRYVRDEQVLTLADALRRMTIEPARRLEARVPEMRERGRIRAGAFADVTVFDPATVIDQSTYVNAAAYSRGIMHVIVNGVPVVRDGAFAEHAALQGQRVLIGTPMPGRPIRAKR